MRVLVLLWALGMASAALATPPTPDALAARIFTSLEAWDLEAATPLGESLAAQAPLSPLHLCALAALDLQRGEAVRGAERLQAALADPAIDASARQTCSELAPRVQAAAALSRRAQTYVSPHFFIRAADKDEIVAHYAKDILERALTAIAGHLRLPLDGADFAPIGVEIYPEVAGLSGATGLSAQAIETSGTIAVCKEHRLMVLSPLATAAGYAWADTLSHELVHLVVGRISRNQAPVWLQEGIAKTYEVSWRGPPGAPIARSTERRLREAAQHNTLIPLARMHPSVALLPSHKDTALAFAEVSSLIDGIRRRVGDAPLANMLARLARVARFDDAWQAPLLSLKAEEAAWRRRLVRLPPLTLGADDEDDDAPTVRLASGPGGATAAPDAVDTNKLPGARRRLARAGELLAVQGHWPAAAEAYRRALAQGGGQSAALLRRRARALAEAGEGAQAIVLLRAALRRAPEQVEASHLLGMLLLAQGDFAAAQPHLRAVTQVNPFVPELHDALSACAHGLGDEATAATELRFAALARAPRPAAAGK